MNQFKNDMMDVQENITDQTAEREQVFKDFDKEIPQIVKRERFQFMKGFKELNQKISNKPQDVYYMIHVNCKYKKPIH